MVSMVAGRMMDASGLTDRQVMFPRDFTDIMRRQRSQHSAATGAGEGNNYVLLCVGRTFWIKACNRAARASRVDLLTRVTFPDSHSNK